MQQLDTSERMTVADYLQLAKLMLEIAADEAMTLSMVDGMITGALCSPAMSSPMALMPLLLGEDGVEGESPGFANAEQAQEFIRLVMKWWNHIASDLLPWRAGESDAPLPTALLLPGTLERISAREWAVGFILAMREVPEVWGDLMVLSKAAWPIYALLNDVTDEAIADNLAPDDPKSFFLTTEQAAALAEQLPHAIVNCLLFFHEQEEQASRPSPPRPTQRAGAGNPGRPPRPERHAGGRWSPPLHSFAGSGPPRMSPFGPTVVNSAPKAGRNATCPCGSGKKYKHCCGAL